MFNPDGTLNVGMIQQALGQRLLPRMPLPPSPPPPMGVMPGIGTRNGYQRGGGFIQPYFDPHPMPPTGVGPFMRPGPQPSKFWGSSARPTKFWGSRAGY